MSEMIDVADEAVSQSQYLTFTSAGQDFAIPIMRMKEIVPYGTSTKVPLVPNVIRGLINLRGRAIPVLDLAVRLGGDETEVTNRTCVLIVDLSDEQDRPDMGILADSVSRVIEVGPTDLEETPRFGLGVSPDYLLGMAKQGECFIPIVDVEKMLRPDEALEAIFSLGESAGESILETSSDPAEGDTDTASSEVESGTLDGR